MIPGFGDKSIEVDGFAKDIFNAFFHWKIVTGHVKHPQIGPSHPRHASQGKTVHMPRHDQIRLEAKSPFLS
jgi:hypothetical protein